MNKLIISLFDYSGTWSQPYKRAGFDVWQIDIKHGDDIFEFMGDVMGQAEYIPETCYGILAAPPCTDFASSGARWFKDKESQRANYYNHKTGLDFQNTVEYSVMMVYATLEIIYALKPKFYAIENPVGRIRSIIPELGNPWYFQPSDFGDPYTKKTAIYGQFNPPAISQPVLPLFGSEMLRYGGKSEKTKAARSITPRGFANAFFNANH